MKKLNLKRLLNLRSFALAGILSAAVFAVSCNDDYIPEEAASPDVMLKDAHIPGEKGNGKSQGAPAPANISIAEIALENEFTELVGALAYVDEELGTGWVEEFSYGTDQYTVFAPTNQAFEDLYTALGVNDLTELENPELVLNVLLYHVVEGRRASNSVVPPRNPREIQPLFEGATFSVDSEAVIWAVETVKPGEKAYLMPPFINLSASNGIVHVIDAVILPVELGIELD
jgi:uncharacterized surface protein with fasciclin (FAS1) repeats